MPALRTEISEIVTGLAMLGHRDLDRALAVVPAGIDNVTLGHLQRLEQARRGGEHDAVFELAWRNGVEFARAEDGLRGRPPWTIEWKGPHKPPGYEQVPADLRVDHVYLVSCKYGSSIVHNAGPAHLFDRHLGERRVERGLDWFAEVAPEAYQELWTSFRDELELHRLPPEVGALSRDDRIAIKASSPRGPWPGRSGGVYREFVVAVAQASAQRWLRGLSTASRRETMLWRLIRLQAAPYFVLGATASGERFHYRVGTPWDFRQRFELRSFDAWPDPAGQPIVRWRADITERGVGRRHVDGHVEVRWSHGRFSGAPEAKVHLDTTPTSVAGYFPLS